MPAAIPSKRCSTAPACPSGQRDGRGDAVVRGPGDAVGTRVAVVLAAATGLSAASKSVRLRANLGLMVPTCPRRRRDPLDAPADRRRRPTAARPRAGRRRALLVAPGRRRVAAIGRRISARAGYRDRRRWGDRRRRPLRPGEPAAARPPVERRNRPFLLYAGIDPLAARDLQLVKWGSRGRASWVDAASIGQPSDAGIGVAGRRRITRASAIASTQSCAVARSTRASIRRRYGTPIVAAADGRVSAAGWAGLWPPGPHRPRRGLGTSYSHMSASSPSRAPMSVVAIDRLCRFVRLSTGPHLHYESTPRPGVNPMSVRFTGAPALDARRSRRSGAAEDSAGIGARG